MVVGIKKKLWVSLNSIENTIFLMEKYELKFLEFCYMIFVLQNAKQASSWEAVIYFTTTQYGTDEM